MPDQADDLRRIVKERAGTAVEAKGPARNVKVNVKVKVETSSIVLTSGKGGVGTSNLALNLAIALGEYGKRVVLVDADLGLANIDLLCGLAPEADLGDVLDGSKSLEQAIVVGPGEIRIVPGAHGLRTLDEVLIEGPKRLVRDWAELEADADFLIVDAGSGLGQSIATIAASADQVVVVTTPEPTSIADAHAALRRLNFDFDFNFNFDFDRAAGNTRKTPRLRAIVNQANTSAEGRAVLEGLAASSRQFLGAVVTPLGHVRGDPRVAIAVRRREPFLTAFPGSIASKCVRKLARTLIEEERGPRGKTAGFFFSLSRSARSILPSRL